jgi:hypothetical protein
MPVRYVASGWNDSIQSLGKGFAALVNAKLPSGLLEPLGLLSLRHLLGRLRLSLLLFGHTVSVPQ